MDFFLSHFPYFLFYFIFYLKIRNNFFPLFSFFLSHDFLFLFIFYLFLFCFFFSISKLCWNSSSAALFFYNFSSSFSSSFFIFFLSLSLSLSLSLMWKLWVTGESDAQHEYGFAFLSHLMSKFFLGFFLLILFSGKNIEKRFVIDFRFRFPFFLYFFYYKTCCDFLRYFDPMICLWIFSIIGEKLVLSTLEWFLPPVAFFCFITTLLFLYWGRVFVLCFIFFFFMFWTQKRKSFLF